MIHITGLRRDLLLTLAMGLCALTAIRADAADELTIGWYTVDGGGGMWSSGDDLQVGATAGQPDAGATGSAGWTLSGGFWVEAVLPWVDLLLATSPHESLEVRIDDVPHTAPYAFTTLKGWSHTIEVESPQPDVPGTKYVYASWSDGGAQTHDIVATEPRTLIASFETWHQLRLIEDPDAGGDVARDPLGEGDPWYPAGVEVELQANPASGWTFANWSCDVPDGHENDNPLTLAMDRPRGVVATFLEPNPPDPPGAVAADMTVMSGVTLNVSGPAPRSLGLTDIGLNGNPQDAPIAVWLCHYPLSGWLQFVNSGPPLFRDDLLPTGTEPEWHTRAEWIGKRIRGLTPGTGCGFYTKTKNAAEVRSALAEAGSYSTNNDCDVNRSGFVNALDYALIKAAIVRTTFSWPCDVDDSGALDGTDLGLTLDSFHNR